MNVTTYDKGIEKGIERERRQSVRELLEDRFGPLSAATLAKLEQLPLDRLQTLRIAISKVASIDDLGLGD